MILLSGFYIPCFCRFPVNFSPNASFIKAGKIKLSVPITMFGCSFCPIKCFCCVSFHAQTIIVEIANLALCQRITFLSKRYMSLKALFILLGFKVFIDETIAFIKFRAWLIVSHIVSSANTD